MANTGYQITPTLIQRFLDGPESGSIVTGSFGKYENQLGVAPFSASLEDTNYYYRALNEVTCPEGFEDCQSPVLTSVQTGSAKGLFNLNYTQPTTLNTAVDITGSISQLEDFSVVQTFSASIGSLLPISSSFTSGTVYFRAFQSCSGPDKSPFSDPLSFTFAPIPPPKPPGSIFYKIQNTLNTPISINVRSSNGNFDQTITPGQTFQSVVSTTAAPDYKIKLKGGSNTTYGNTIIKRISTRNGAVAASAHVTSPNSGPGNFNGTKDGAIIFYDGKATVDIKRNFNPPTDGIVDINLTFASNTPPAPPVAPPPPAPSAPVPYTPRPTIRFGGSAFSTADGACNSSDFRSQTYFQLGNYIYLTSNDAIAGNRPSFPNTRNYILTNTSQHTVVSSNGYIIESSNNCSYPTITFSRSSYPDQETACKTKIGNPQTKQIKDGRLIGSSLSGRFKLNTSRGGRNIILSGGKVVAYENCGTEGSLVVYTRYGYSKSRLQNPRTLKNACTGVGGPRSYFLGPSGILYYSSSGTYAYIPLGLGSRYYFSGTTAYLFDRGRITQTVTPCP